MKPVQFNFILRPLYPWIWGIAVALMAAVCARVSWQAHSLQQHQAAISEQILTQRLEMNQQRLNQTTKATPAALVPNFAKQAQLAAQILSLDLNKALSSVENLHLLGVRLLSLSINTSGNTVDVEFELGTLALAAQVSEELMSGYAVSPWKLQATNQQVRSMVPTVGNAPVTSYVGRWQAKLDQL